MMIIKRRAFILLALLVPCLASALGLGEIHLVSALNQPLSADIEVTGAANEELSSLNVALAGRELFTRYGIDRPAYLSSLTFKVVKNTSNRATVQVRSAEPIREPFVTLLVEASWASGRLVREYTVLLDPPVFESKPTTAPVIVAAVTGESASAVAGKIERAEDPSRVTAASVQAASAAPPVEPSANTAVRQPAPVVVKPAPPPKPVRPRATRASAPVTTSSVPSTTAVAASEYTVRRHDSLSAIVRRTGVDSRADVERMMLATFKANPAAFDGNINRLRAGAHLRLPASSEWESLNLDAAHQEVSRQDSAWRDGTVPEEAHLKLVPAAQPVAVAKPEAAAGAKGSAGAAVVAAGSVDAGAASSAGTAAADSTQRLSALQNEIAEAKRLLELKNAELAQLQGQTTPPAPVDATATPVASDAGATAPAVKPATKSLDAAVANDDSGLWAWIKNNIFSVLVAAAVVLLLLGALIARSRREKGRDEPEDFMESATLSASAAPRTGNNLPPRSTILVEESHAPHVDLPKTAPSSQRSIDDTMSAEGPLNLDTADPVKEAEFHLAYGLYPQAADVLVRAIAHEPQRRELKYKLLEVHFVAGDKAAFVALAHELSRKSDQDVAGLWDQVLIMGRQIAAEDPLFVSTGKLSATLDMNLGERTGGQTSVDLNPTERVDGAAPPVTDLNVGAANAVAKSASGPVSLAEASEQMLDLDSLDRALAKKPAAERTAASTADSPTMEMPRLIIPPTRPSQQIDATAEMSVSDLNFSLDELAKTGSIPAAEAATLIAAMSDNDRARLEDIDAARMSNASVTFSEVGTKLDLARAYIEMADPEGARSILAEVLSEGTPTQRQDAERLLQTLRS